jgi:hypothetical protein
MNTSRRNVLLSTLFGAGCVGLRALATGLPLGLLLNPKRALAGTPCPAGSTPQYVILCTSGSGDPLNANAPGTYEDPNIYHSSYSGPDGTMAPVDVTLGTKTYKAATPWATANLPADRTQVWHVMTNTPVHPKEPEVLALMGGISPAEMFPSFLARQLQPCLGTIQAQPITVGATSPSEGLTYAGAALPIIPPLSLQKTLLNPTGPLTSLQKVRDDTLTQLNDLYLTGASPAQRSFVESMITSQGQVRSISQQLLESLSTITNNSADSQIIAAVALIQMKVAPVVAIHIPFGGDNHHDTGLTAEGQQTIAGMNTLGTLLANLKTATPMDLSDLVTVMSLNVFGRTIDQTNTDGRQHNLNHQVSFAIGKPFKGGVYGGVAALPANMGGDYGCLPMSSATGAGSTGGDIKPVDTLAAFGMTIATGVGASVMAETPTGGIQQITSNPVYNPAGLNTAKVVTGALA